VSSSIDHEKKEGRLTRPPNQKHNTPHIIAEGPYPPHEASPPAHWQRG
jgi:hypothetical protein